MVALGKSISHTENSLGYGWNQEKEAVIVLRRHLTGDNPKEISSEFRLVQKLNCNCSVNTLSFVLSPTIDDGKRLSNKHLKLITHSFLNKMNLLEHQAIAFCHNDKNHKHIHLYVNRINFDGTAYKDGRIGIKSQKKAKEIAEELNLQTVEEAVIIKLNLVKNERKEILKIHREILSKGEIKNYEAYRQELLINNIELIPKYDKTKVLRGFRYRYKDLNLKASEVHRTMSFNNLNEALKRNKLNLIKTHDKTRINIGGINR